VGYRGTFWRVCEVGEGFVNFGDVIGYVSGVGGWISPSAGIVAADGSSPSRRPFGLPGGDSPDWGESGSPDAGFGA
jgi:hypothetical protein